MGLFSANWKTKDRNKLDKALASVQKTTDPGELKRIALEAPLAEVKLEAIKKIGDPLILRELTLTGNPFVCSEAIARIHDQAILKELVYSKAAYPDQAVVGIKDQDVLLEIAKTAPNGAARVRAAEQITGQDALKDLVITMVFKDNGSDMTAAAAASKLENMEDLNSAEETLRPWGRNAQRTLDSIRRRKIQLLGQGLHDGERLILICRKCGKQVRYREYWDQDHDSWEVDGEYYCSCKTHPVKKGAFPEEPAWEAAVSGKPVNGNYFELCPVCMQVRSANTGVKVLAKCFHLTWNSGKQRDEVFNDYKTITVPYQRAEW
ncbi:MAG: hypothetical protein IJM62_01310 [Lachnospiraceae bacterium]|nr:hypothetical protein [Lachnospiraceae bacterium]